MSNDEPLDLDAIRAEYAEWAATDHATPLTAALARCYLRHYPALLAESERLRAREGLLRAMVEHAFRDGWKWGTTCGDEFDDESFDECWQKSSSRRELESTA